MTELDYIKEKFLEDAHLLNFYKIPEGKSEKDVLNSFLLFKESLYDNLKEIKSANSIEDVTHYINEIRTDFFIHWHNVKHFNIYVCYEHMRSFFYDSHINEPEKWIKETQENYHHKKIGNFFGLVGKGLSFIDKKVFNKDFDYREIENYANKIIDKYNLKSIDLSFIKSHNAMNFLQNLDNKLINMCDSLGVAYDVVGIHGTISFSATPNNEAFFIRNSNTISVDSSTTSSTLLHEWIHGIDYHVGNKVRQHHYASEINDSVYMSDSNQYNAFASIKKITQEIFSSSDDVVSIEKVKNEILQEATSKFFSEVLGYEFYLLPESTKRQLHTKEAFQAVNNYLLVSDSKNNQNKVLHFMSKAGIYSEEFASILKEQKPEILILKSHFDSINKNIWGKQSFYHLSSTLSQYGLKAQLYLEKAIHKTINLIKQTNEELKLGNIGDNDYFTQPTEMLARYFESQVFPKSTLIVNVIQSLQGVQAYKFGVDDSFEENKNKVIEHVFGKDKILKNIQGIRKENNNKPSNLPPTFNNI